MDCLFAIAALAACGEGPAPTPSEPAAVAIVGARLIDGTGADPVDDAVIVVQDGRIQATGPESSTSVPTGTEVVDGAGKTIIPGLVETHSHFNGELERVEPQLRKQLYFGVTTSRSIGSDTPEKVVKLLEAHAGQIVGPRMFTAGRGFSHVNGFPPGRPTNQPTTEDEAREMVRGLAGQGVHFVKMWVNKMPEPGLKITPEIRAAIVDEAMKQDLVPVAHIDEEADVRQLIDVGVRDFLHTVTDTEVGEEFLQLCLDNGVTFSPTLTNTHSLSIWAEHPELLEDPEIHASFEPESYAKWIDPAYREEWMAQPSFEARKIRLQGLKAFVKTVVDAGIPVAVGTDSGASTWNVPMGWGTHHELELFVEAGLTPMQAIVAATRNGAALISKGEPEFGTLEAGMVADLIVLNADPLTDIQNTRAIDRVMQRGEWVDRSVLLPVP